MELTFESFQMNLNEVISEINSACQVCNRHPEEVTLMAVTKTHPVQAVDFAERAGLTCVGENRVQEAVSKKNECSASIRWELIGHLQGNKARQAVQTFDRIQSVDSLKLIQQLDRLCEELSRPTLRILLQVNAGNDPAKFGMDMDDVPALLAEALKSKYLQVDGFMTIAPLSDDPDVAAFTFENLRTLRDAMEQRFARKFPELSMGMSGDLESAIRHGATMIRVGTALFGHRGKFV